MPPDLTGKYHEKFNPGKAEAAYSIYHSARWVLVLGVDEVRIGTVLDVAFLETFSGGEE